MLHTLEIVTDKAICLKGDLGSIARGAHDPPHGLALRLPM
jgi:hypothetical protein